MNPLSANILADYAQHLREQKAAADLCWRASGYLDKPAHDRWVWCFEKLNKIHVKMRNTP
jgi:hypothetical protein